MEEHSRRQASAPQEKSLDTPDDLSLFPPSALWLPISQILNEAQGQEDNLRLHRGALGTVQGREKWRMALVVSRGADRE